MTTAPISPSDARKSGAVSNLAEPRKSTGRKSLAPHRTISAMEFANADEDDAQKNQSKSILKGSFVDHRRSTQVHSQVYTGVPRKSQFMSRLPVDIFGPPPLIKETINSHRQLRLRLKELEKINNNNDQIVLFFVGTPDKNGRSWHADSNITERAVNFLLKKLQIGGFFLKVHVGNRDEWLDLDNPYKNDPKIQLMNIPTLWVWGSFKRIFGRRCYDLESVYLLLKD